MSKLLVIDGLSLAYRMLYKRGYRLTSPSGEPTHGVYGFVKEMFSLAARHQPDMFAVAWDAPRSTYERRRIFKGYKAARPTSEAAPDPQLARIQELVQALDIQIIIQPGWEADDVIATLARLFSTDGHETIIVGVDKDLHQLISPNVRMWNSHDSAFTGVREVREKWGGTGRRVIEIQTLAGDSTDGIPGVPGIGLKTAMALLEEYGSIDNLLDDLDCLSPKKQRAFEEFDFDLGRKLVELNTNLELSCTYEDLVFEGFNMKKARPLFRELGFKSFLGDS